jgi:hypothetical protein
MEYPVSPRHLSFQFDQGSMNFPITDIFELGQTASLLLQPPVQHWKPIE